MCFAEGKKGLYLFVGVMILAMASCDKDVGDDMEGRFTWAEG